MAHFEKAIESEALYNGKILRLRRDIVELENGKTAKREVVEHSGGVCVLPFDDDGNVILVRQFRYPFGRELLEAPAGKLEKGEDHATCGRRELEEEAGMTAGIYRYLGCIYPTPAYDTEIIHMYYAADLRPASQHLDQDEFLTVLRFPFDESLQMALDGRICDAKTKTALLQVAVLRQNKLL